MEELKMWQAWTNAVLGAWIFILAFFHTSPRFNLWDNLIIGILAVIVGVAITYKRAWQGWLCAIVGFWLIIAAFIPSLLTYNGNLWNGIISGALLMVGGFGAILGFDHRTTHLHGHAY